MATKKTNAKKAKAAARKSRKSVADEFKPVADCWHGAFADADTKCVTNNPILQLDEKQMHKMTFDQFFDLAKKSGYEVWIDLKSKSQNQIRCEAAEREIAKRLGAKKVQVVHREQDIRINFFGD